MLTFFKTKLDATLKWTAVIHLGLAVLFILLSIVDNRYVLGIPLWYKPFKFAVSIAVYTITLAYLVPVLQSKRIATIISRVTSIALFVEMILIALQAGRGTLSHYNRVDALGITIYAIMGVFIVTASILLIWLGIRLHREPPNNWSASFRSAVQMGIWGTAIGTVIGGYMSSRTGHTVGAKDGGNGLPLLNWSTLHGDWRVPHFIGLHALQLFILLGWLVRNRSHAKRIQWIVFVIYLALLTVTVVMTLQGKPVV
jgi:hypothetical protein